MTEGAFTVLTVCEGNVNRSALAAALLTSWVDWYVPHPLAEQIRITSAGLGAPVGASMGRRTRAIAGAFGADGSAHRARQISEDLVRTADLVLVSSAKQRDGVLRLVPGALRSTYSIREAGRIAAALAQRTTPLTVDDLRATVSTMADNRIVSRSGNADDIVDPQGRDDSAYLEMARQEIPSLAQLAAALFGMPAAEVSALAAATQDSSILDGRVDAAPRRAGGRHRA